MGFRLSSGPLFIEKVVDIEAERKRSARLTPSDKGAGRLLAF